MQYYLFLETLKSDPRVEDIKLIQGSLWQEKAALQEEEEEVEEKDLDETGDGERGESEEESEEEEEIEAKRHLTLTNMQNKFSLLADDE